jgi:hypothetical protein
MLSDSIHGYSLGAVQQLHPWWRGEQTVIPRPCSDGVMQLATPPSFKSQLGSLVRLKNPRSHSYQSQVVKSAQSDSGLKIGVD